MEWKQATFKLPASWRDHVNRKATEWGCDAGSIWMAAIDAFFREENARTVSIQFMLALKRERGAFEDVLPGKATELTEDWEVQSRGRKQRDMTAAEEDEYLISGKNPKRKSKRKRSG